MNELIPTSETLAFACPFLAMAGLYCLASCLAIYLDQRAHRRRREQRAAIDDAIEQERLK